MLIGCPSAKCLVELSNVCECLQMHHHAMKLGLYSGGHLDLSVNTEGGYNQKQTQEAKELTGIHGRHAMTDG